MIPMELSKAHFRKILNAIPIPAFVVDCDARVLDLNEAGVCRGRKVRQ